MAVLTAPFVRFLLALALGAGVGWAITPTQQLYAAVCGALVVIVSVFVTIGCITRLRQHRYYNVLGILVLQAWSFLGCLLMWQTDPAIDRTHFSHFGSKALIGKVAEEPVLRGNHVRFPLSMRYAYINDSLHNVTGTLMLTVRIADSLASEPFRYGDELLIPSSFEAIPPPYNPGELDYKRYLAGKNMWHQDYLLSDQLKRLRIEQGNPLIAYALDLRRRMVAKFAAYISDRDALSVASALILGYRAEMSDRLVQAFSNTGTIHVLSVSGMHVVLVFWLLAKLLWWMDGSKGLRATKFIILLLAVWGYAVLTGFSPPVLRASIMVGFVMAATIFGRQNRIYNSIAASAFFLLLYEPKFIVDIGFQLSYLAVLGIVFVHPLIRAVFSIRNRLLRPITDYIGMSIGAQAGAGPLAAYYFHQFPLYFLPANLLIVLPTSGIMYVGFALLVLPGGLVTRWLGEVLEGLILATNTSLAYVEQWPMASIGGIWPAKWESLLVYVLIVSVAMAIMSKRKQWVYGALGCVTISVCTSFSAAFTNTAPQAIIFNVGRNLAIGLVGREEAWVYTNLPAIDDRTMEYSVLPALESRVPVANIHFMPDDSVYLDRQVYAKGGVLQFGDARFMVYDGIHTYDGHMDVDVVLLRNNPQGSLAELLKAINCKQLIVDGSNYDSTIGRWTAEAEAAALPVYVLKDNFAYVWPLQSPLP